VRDFSLEHVTLGGARFHITGHSGLWLFADEMEGYPLPVPVPVAILIRDGRATVLPRREYERFREGDALAALEAERVR
jgi:hypothetical protein